MHSATATASLVPIDESCISQVLYFARAFIQPTVSVFLFEALATFAALRFTIVVEAVVAERENGRTVLQGN
jgi:hypothetical protein